MKSQIQLSDFTFSFHFPALEKERETHSSVLAWRIPGMAEPGGLPSMVSHRVGHDWSDLAACTPYVAALLVLWEDKSSFIMCEVPRHLRWWCVSCVIMGHQYMVVDRKMHGCTPFCLHPARSPSRRGRKWGEERRMWSCWSFGCIPKADV